MNVGRTVFAQLIAHLSHVEFQKCVARYDGDDHHRSLSCWDQYLAMAFAQFTYRESLRDIEACLRSMSDKKQQEELRETMAAAGVKSWTAHSFHQSSGTMEEFAKTLSGYLDRPVKDMTQVEGKYSLSLAWVEVKEASTSSDGGLSEPSIFAALQEQLGLKLEAGKESLEILVIDKAEKVPTAN